MTESPTCKTTDSSLGVSYIVGVIAYIIVTFRRGVLSTLSCSGDGSLVCRLVVEKSRWMEKASGFPRPGRVQ